MAGTPTGKMSGCAGGMFAQEFNCMHDPEALAIRRYLQSRRRD
jgi:hypothetical protein